MCSNCSGMLLSAKPGVDVSLCYVYRLSCASFRFQMCFVQVFSCCLATKRTLNPLSHRYACSSAKVCVCACGVYV